MSPSIYLGDPEVHEIGKYALAGFELVGWRRKDGKLILGATEESGKGVVVDDFPEKSTIKGFNTYSLEETKEQGDGLEWGIYV